MHYVSCDSCGGDDHTVLFEAGVAQVNQIVKCNQCGLMYANPRAQPPDCESIQGYDPNYFPKHELRAKFEKEALQVQDYAKVRGFLNSNYSQKGSLIEIGSSFGYLLNSFKKDGWQVQGIEPLKIGCQYTETEFGIKAVPVTLEEAHLEENSVDIVIMLHVIEHVPSPSSTLREIFRVLKPGGLLVLETPRYDTWMFKLLGKRERSLSCDGHIYFFTTDTLRNLAKQIGFEATKMEYVGRSLTLERLLWNLGVISKSERVKQLINTLSVRLSLNQIKLYLNVRDMQRAYLKKPQW